jgi:hypothetical protein
MPTETEQQTTPAAAGVSTPPSFNSPLSALPICDVTVIIGVRDRNGRRSEIQHDLGPEVTIRSCSHSVLEKTVINRDPETKAIMGHEPTGEYELNLKVKYTKGD